MQPDSLKRLLVLAVAAAILTAQPFLAKYGLPHTDAAGALSLAGLVVGYLMQSGLKSALDKASQNKALGTVIADAQKAKALFDSLKAAQALAAGQAAATAPQGSGPSQA